MPIRDEDVQALQDDAVIDAATAARIREWLVHHGTSDLRSDRGDGGASGVPTARFDLVHAAYYLGGAVILFALGWFAVETWERYGGAWLVGVSLVYAVGLAALAERWWRQRMIVPAGLLFTATAAMAAIFLFALQDTLGLWPSSPAAGGAFARLHGHRLVQGAGTLAATLAVMRLRPFALHAALLAAAVGYTVGSMGPLLAAVFGVAEPEGLQMVGAAGLLLLAAAYLVDHRTRPDYAFWLYVGGLALYWFLLLDRQYGHVAFAAVNTFLIGLGLLLQRRAFVVAGAIGIFVYLAHLAGEVFRDSLLFPAALVAIGLALIFGGVWLARRQDRARAWLTAHLPRSLAAALPQNR